MSAEFCYTLVTRLFVRTFLTARMKNYTCSPVDAYFIDVIVIMRIQPDTDTVTIDDERVDKSIVDGPSLPRVPVCRNLP